MIRISATLLFAALITAALIPPSPAAAQTADYETCLLRAKENPEKARSEAMSWAALGGGAPARHCAALAAIGVGADRIAAEELTELATAPGGLPAADRFSALMLAGELWLSVGIPDLASETYERAAKLDLESPAPAIGSARAAAAREEWIAVFRHLGDALRRAPDHPEALTLRAAAHRATGEPQKALDDAVLATELAPDVALTWFERGAAEMLLDAPQAAERSWLRAAELDPQGVAGDLARVNLQKLLFKDATE